MENNLPSILGGMAQGFTDFGKGLFDMFGTGGASVLDLIESAKTGNVTNRRQDDFRKWLYQTDSTKDAAAKGLGTALNGVQTVADYIPGVNALTQTTLGNAAQGALGGLADELKTYGEDYDLGRAGQRAAISAAGAAVSGGLADALKGSNNALLSSNTIRGLARGATGGAISGGGYAAIDGGDVLEAAKQGAGMGALIGGATGAFQDFKPSKAYNVALTDDERAARIANAQKQIDDIGAVSRFSNNPDDIAKRARINELQGAIKAYQSGYDTVQDYTDAMAAKRANRANTQSATTTQGQVYTPDMGEMEYGAPVQDGYTRLYRGMTQEFDPQYNRNAMDNMNGYESWTDSYDLANRYGDGKYVYSIDVPTSRIANSLFDENPNSATYGNRNFISAIDKAAGLDGVDGNEYLLNTNDELRSGLTYNRVNAPKALETTLSDADMAVNNPRYLTDENGNPRTFYHGSPNKNITEFDINQAGKNTSSGEHALYFTDSPQVADDFSYERLPGDSMFIENKGAKGRVYPVNLEMNNPLDLDNLSDAQIRELWEYASPLGQLDGQEKFIRNLTDWRDNAHNAQLTKGYLDLDKLRDSQYDGFMARMYPNQDNQAREYAVFDNSKVKMLEDVLANDDMAVNSPKLTPEQEAYFKDSVIRDENGNLKKLYHGSPNGEFYVFDNQYGNPENDWGKGFYFTDNEADVKKNYTGGGPDFDNKVARRAEQIQDELGIDYDAAEQQARKEMYKGAYTIDAYANMKDPATVGKTNLFDGTEYGVKPLSDYDNIDDYYTDLIYDLTDDVINDTNIDYNYKNDIMAILDEARWNGGIGLQELKDALNNLYIEDYDGRLVGGDVARSIVQNLGYDGIVDPTVSGKFNNMGIENGTTHYIAFEPNQIKNINNLNPTENPDIRYSKAAPSQSLEKTLANSDAEINRVGSADVAPIDTKTLPKSLQAAQEYLNEGNYINDIEKFTGKPYQKLTNQDFLEYSLSLKNPDDKEFFRTIIDDMVNDGTTTYEKYASAVARNKRLDKLMKSSFDDMDAKSLGRYLANNRTKLNNGTIKDIDAELSDRLGIGRSNTLMRDNYLPPDALGAYDPTNSTISIDTNAPEESLVNTLAHERLHSFQTEGDFKRYDKRVTDAYEELSKDLNKYLKTPEETAKRYAFDTDYWSNEREQQSRMLQQYLENKGFTRGGLQKSNAGEWGNEINPAFDKFFDKLRDLSKRGVALPALAALFGGGAYMASQENDEDKEKEVK